ncbi:hypothetical protein PHYSODRAFT_337660 [Phytophthora sojae]|uniref:Ion transport domain-containing protein n=1 Tax=Phytophthora sojae (strain P6497) TaxID=1094619 RepID=G5A1T8_PHYSP|nr:hypothetical protein PHYSODRAFT_337660 [Phytophthora sojae]EGZ10886.1 hypothetical protein PHYSODRAFT_337660 [Phytophthora sojae]|eukprot:XP_009533631.1 hypothetical protein PHYSODRAFT_337660 [Phytophthora sojae]
MQLAKGLVVAAIAVMMCFVPTTATADVAKENTPNAIGADYALFWFLTRENWVRRWCIRVVSHRYFDGFIIFCIVLNTVVLAIVDFSVVDEGLNPTSHGKKFQNGALVDAYSMANHVVEIFEFVLTGIFTLECVLKLVALGVKGKGSYWKDSWNVVDFFMLFASFVAEIPGMPNISEFRAVRVLRPLRSLSAFPGMRRLITALLNAIPALQSVVALQMFAFLIFGILGIQLFGGRMGHVCRLTEFPVRMPATAANSWPVSDAYLERVIANASAFRCLEAPLLDFSDATFDYGKDTSPWRTPQDCFWPLDYSVRQLCAEPSHPGGYRCRAGSTCGSNYDAFGNPRFRHSKAMQEALHTAKLNWGFTTYDHIGRALLTIFQSVTEEGWTLIMYMTMDASHPVVGACFAIALIIFASYFVMNLTIAVISEEFKMALKIVGLGWKGYIRDKFNAFDAVIVGSDILEAAMEPPSFLVSTHSALESTHSKKVDYNCKVPRSNFDTLPWAIATVFQVITGDNWSAVLYDAIRGNGMFASVYFTILQVMLGDFVLMNLFLALLLDNFAATSESSTSETQAKRPSTLIKRRSKISPIEANKQRIIRRMVVARTGSSDLHWQTPREGRHNSARSASALQPHDSATQINSFASNRTLIGHGLQHFDTGSILLLANISDTNSVLQTLLPLRDLRALRPLRMISRRPGLKLVVSALIESIPAVLNVVFLSMALFLLFSIAAVHFLKGRFRACTGDVLDSLPTDQKEFLVSPAPWDALSDVQRSWFSGSVCEGFPTEELTSQYVCECWGATWKPVLSKNFDNLGSAMLTFFILSTSENWSEIMKAACDATRPGMQPIVNNNELWIVFFIVFMVVGSFFVMNVFVGVIIENFNTMKAKLGGDFLLTPEQKKWMEAQKSATRIGPIRMVNAPTQVLRRVCFSIVRTRFFEGFVMSCILVNTLLMASQHFGESPQQLSATYFVSELSTGILAIEAAMKILGYGRAYFEDNWNRFDFLIAIGTVFGTIAQTLASSSLWTLTMMVRLIRVARIFCLVESSNSIRAILSTVYISLPGLSNITSILFLILFVYSTMGVHLFAKVALTSDIDRHANFQSFGVGFLFLLRAATGESWDHCMYDLASSTLRCVSDPQYDPGMCGFNNSEDCTPLNGCGNPVAYFFFCSFTLIVSYVMLNLTVAVVLEGFASSQQEDDDDDAIFVPELLEEFQ